MCISYIAHKDRGMVVELFQNAVLEGLKLHSHEISTGAIISTLHYADSDIFTQMFSFNCLAIDTARAIWLDATDKTLLRKDAQRNENQLAPDSDQQELKKTNE